MIFADSTRPSETVGRSLFIRPPGWSGSFPGSLAEFC